MKHAFTLVELSIVLVILGLLVGGVLAGQNLIRAAELRSVTTEFTNYQTAAMTFKEKYFALPGDMTNATAFWGSATCYGTAGTGTQTCDGDGDGALENVGGAGAFNEHNMFWQHLANAGLIEGTYTGMALAGSSIYVSPGENVPVPKLTGAVWSMRYLPNEPGGTSGAAAGIFFENDYQNALTFSGIDGSGSPTIALLDAQEAWNIDTKVDDGKPGRGRIMAGRYNVCTTTTDETNLDAEYDLDADSVACSLIYPRVF